MRHGKEKEERKTEEETIDDLGVSWIVHAQQQRPRSAGISHTK